jgi:hypothetical protein
MKQTATEWLFEKLWDSPKDKLTWNAILEQAKEIEKEQIIDAVDETISEISMYKSSMTYENGEQYYNNTYDK